MDRTDPIAVMEALVGKTIQSIEVDTDEGLITFTLNGAVDDIEADEMYVDFEEAN